MLQVHHQKDCLVFLLYCQGYYADYLILLFIRAYLTFHAGHSIDSLFRTKGCSKLVQYHLGPAEMAQFPRENHSVITVFPSDFHEFHWTWENKIYYRNATPMPKSCLGNFFSSWNSINLILFNLTSWGHKLVANLTYFFFKKYKFLNSIINFDLLMFIIGCQLRMNLGSHSFVFNRTKYRGTTMASSSIS